MSLYVFIVSSGTTLKFDVEFAVKKVLELKNAISNRKGIPVQDQVLLCSGGEELKCDAIVGNYSGAGTDTNPIFLFHKGLFDPNNGQLPHLQNDPIVTSLDLSIENDVKGCANMIPSIQSLTVKATIAQRFGDYALKGKEECIALVRDQHLQHQGWAAVIANLDDIKDSLQKSFHHLCDLFGKFLENVPKFQEILTLALDDIALLAKVPVLPKLIGDNDESTEQELETKHTLLTWFCTEPQYYIVSVVEKCKNGIAALNEECLRSLKEEFQNVLKDADNPDVKEIKGIEGRLANLNQLIEIFEAICKDQNEIKITVFSPDKIHHARDPNLLPDLCITFQRQLGLMLSNHVKLIENLGKCTKAKGELSGNINQRIQYISLFESNISRMQTKIHNYRKYMQSVMNQIDCLHQVHLAPQRYLRMCTEVCRRKEFSARFMKWAGELSSQCLKLYENEIFLRKNISKETKNMVDGLFPGMNDLPPPFAIECPQPFDQHLPEVTSEDLEWLKTCVPELSHLCEVLPSEPFPCISQAESDSAFSSNIPSSLKIKFIQELQKNLQHDLSNLKATVKDELCEGMSEASHIVENINSYMQRLNQQMLLEKEEQVSEAKKEFSSKENAYIHQLEIESQKLNDAENQILDYEKHLRETRSNLEDLKHENKQIKQKNEQLLCDLQKQKILTNSYLLEHELELDSLKNQMKEKVDEQDCKINELNKALFNAVSEITNLKEEKSRIEEDYNMKLQKEQSILSDMQEKQKNLNQEIIRLQELKDVSNNTSELEMKLKLINSEKIQCLKDLEEAQQSYDKIKTEVEASKEIALKEMEEKLSIQHNKEKEAIRCRYRFTLEALPFASDIESLDPELRLVLEDLRNSVIQSSDLWNDDLQAFVEIHQSELDGLKKEILKRQKERDKLILTLKSEHEEALEKLKSRITAESQVSFNEAINRLAKEKDAVIEDLRSQLSVLEAKMFATKAHLSQHLSPSEVPATITESPMSQSDSGASCSSKILPSNEESNLLTKVQKGLEELVLEPSTTLSQSTRGSLAPSESLKKAPSQYACFDCHNKISILTCNEGDLVLLCYEERHENFAVFHFGPFVHFLHSDSLQALNLKLPAGPNERWALGVVVRKEFCVTKKQENRYKVSCGTKFYRVKVKPWDRETALALHQLQRSTHMTSTICSSKPSTSQSSSKDSDGGIGGSDGMSASSI